MDKVRRGMSELNTERQHPEQLGLFKDDDFIQQIIKQKIFLSHGDDLRYFQEGKVPPNDKDKYYFGVKFSDEEHKLLITIFRKPKDVLDFYLQAWKNNASGRLDEMTEVFDRNKIDAFVREILSDRYVPMINGGLIISAAKKIVNKLKKDTQLSNIIKKYEKISEKLHQASDNLRKLPKRKRRYSESKLDKKEVIAKIGGWVEVEALVKQEIKKLYNDYQNDREFVWGSVVNDDYSKTFINGIVGVEQLTAAEKMMVEKIIRWMFRREREKWRRRMNRYIL